MDDHDDKVIIKKHKTFESAFAKYRKCKIFVVQNCCLMVFHSSLKIPVSSVKLRLCCYTCT